MKWRFLFFVLFLGQFGFSQATKSSDESKDDSSYTYTKFGANADAVGFKDYTEVAVTFGHRWQFGRWGILADAGFYLYRPKDIKRAYYEGVGLSYHINPRLQAIARLKAHLSTADYMEWGFSYTL